MTDFLNIMNERFATKEFSNKKISEADMKKIIEFGRLSPSSFGLEHWKFILVSTQDVKDKLVSACYNQSQVAQASDVIVILSKRKEFEKGSNYISEVFKSRMPEDVAERVIPMAQGFLDNLTDEQKDSWSKKQCYIAAANMMTGAKSLGIDSCPMEGFVENAVASVLDIDLKDYGVALVIPFGYASKSGRPKTRFSFEEVVEFR